MNSFSLCNIFRNFRINCDIEINKEEADVVRLIFELYTVGEKQSDNTFNRLGTGFIAKRLNTMKVSPKRGKVWVVASIRDILINPVYIGMIRWNWRPQQKKMIDGQLHISRPRATDYVLCNGLHQKKHLIWHRN